MHILMEGGLGSPASVRAVQVGRALRVPGLEAGMGHTALLHPPLPVPPWKGKAVAVLSQSRTKDSFILSGDATSGFAMSMSVLCQLGQDTSIQGKLKVGDFCHQAESHF